MMYKLNIPDFFTGQQTVVRLSDMATIPFDPANTDYQEYLKGVAVGKKTESADEYCIQLLKLMQG